MIVVFKTLPVIALHLRSPLLDWWDSFLSMLHMHSGVLVATVSVEGARNAAILATQIASLHNKDILRRLERMKRELAREVKEQSENVKSKQPSASA